MTLPSSNQQGNFGKSHGVHPDRICDDSNSAGGVMTAAILLRRRDKGKISLAAQVIIYPEARLPFEMPAAIENNSGYYL